MDKGKSTRVYAPGSVVYAQGDMGGGVHCIRSGLVGIRRLEGNGDSTLLRLVNPGETVGYRAFLTSAPHENSAEVLMTSSICTISRPALRAVFDRNPNIGLRFLDHSLRDLKQTEDRYVESVSWKARTKLLHMLLVLNERFGCEVEGGGYRIELPISRQDFAGLIGAAPETMSRTIHRIQNEGLAHFDGRVVWISSIDAISNDVQLLM
jgi:CRP/FNR family transcriptional regulator